jgi:hypothetical protein
VELAVAGDDEVGLFDAFVPEADGAEFAAADELGVVLEGEAGAGFVGFAGGLHHHERAPGGGVLSAEC